MLKRSSISKKIISFTLSVLLLVLIASCEKFPSNPEKDGVGSGWVQIQHVDTDYITTQTTLSGLAAKKVNLLTFEIQANHFDAQALEVFGRVILEGPPYEREHNLHFRTDQLLQQEDGSGDCYDNIHAELPYQLVRSKFPTNEYSPFIGDQGKVKQVIITNVIAYDSHGNAVNIPVEPETPLCE